MRLFLLFILIFFYKNVSPLSIFVKFSWRDNGQENFLYYQYLSTKESGRFTLELTGNASGYLSKKITDIHDTYHFKDDDVFRGNGEKINEFNLQISFDGYNVCKLI